MQPVCLGNKAFLCDNLKRKYRISGWGNIRLRQIVFVEVFEEFGIMIKMNNATAPTANIVSPKALVHFIVLIKPVCRNSALLAYQ